MNYLLTGDGDGDRSTRAAGEIIGRVVEREGGRITGRVIAARNRTEAAGYALRHGLS